MARNTSHLAAIAVIAAALAAPAFAQEQTGTASTTDTKDDVRVFDALVVTGATLDADDQRWASDAKADVPEIADGDWVPAQASPSE
jgi:hypothetical protein